MRDHYFTRLFRSRDGDLGITDMPIIASDAASAAVELKDLLRAWSRESRRPSERPTQAILYARSEDGSITDLHRFTAFQDGVRESPLGVKPVAAAAP